MKAQWSEVVRDALVYRYSIVMSILLFAITVEGGPRNMFLELIHGLFITKTEFRLSTTFIPIIIIMHIYNWYHSLLQSSVIYIG